ncbi:MAG: hypothetical protein A3G91_06100 [Omnitrophica WOR_2 bacterium RIFCSPLOWO2_12_FULL_50_9]|nr:MAG: hypothetical protein A3D87_01280 [Omnitrophica WOR_2 bacterium RIFCSPHIGHO2_02_FULL_50_17]OGX42088.1 MAG: hypothetical protein A3G91_06100 [Omnitrophica WOR_2 bacterium RIFCSPLOWO2_12_FULL_50_9]
MKPSKLPDASIGVSRQGFIPAILNPRPPKADGVYEQNKLVLRQLYLFQYHTLLMARRNHSFRKYSVVKKLKQFPCQLDCLPEDILSKI